MSEAGIENNHISDLWAPGKWTSKCYVRFTHNDHMWRLVETFKGGRRMPISGSSTTLWLSVDKSEEDEDTGRRFRAGRAKIIEELTTRRVITEGSDGWKHYIDANWKT